jgi:ketosteroid isomerase-like protein
MDATPEQALVERYLAAYNAFDIEGMLAQLAPDVRFENWAGGEMTVSSAGIEEFRVLAEQARGMFSTREQRIAASTARGDGLLVAIAWSGTLAVDVPDGPKAGTELALRGESEFGFRDGLIARIVDRS